MSQYTLEAEDLKISKLPENNFSTVSTIYNAFRSPRSLWQILKPNFKAFVRVMLRHRTESHIMNSFVQTFIVLLVALVTFFFDLDDFSDRIMVNAVLLLAMATITSSIQEVRIDRARDPNKYHIAHFPNPYPTCLFV